MFVAVFVIIAVSLVCAAVLVLGATEVVDIEQNAALTVAAVCALCLLAAFVVSLVGVATGTCG